MITRVISGGQIGADIAGLRAAKSLGIETGGWMPRGWMTKDGPHPEYAHEYGMEECPVEGYPARTRLNVESSDATLRFAHDFHTAGEVVTMNAIRELEKTYHDVPIKRGAGGRLYIAPEHEHLVKSWFWHNRFIHTLNIAGNASRAIEPCIEEFLVEVLPRQ